MPNPEPIDASVVPRFAGMPSFMRLPYQPDPGQLDVALIGVPWDGGTTNRAGARHGPREIRSMSSFMRRVHPVSKIAPYELCRVGDLGDAPVNPIDLEDSLARIQAFYETVVKAGAMPLSAGGDHLITLPILRAVAKERSVGLIQFDSHSDTNDRYFGENRYTHGTPFRRAIEDGLVDPRRSIQVGIRGSLYDAHDLAYAEQAGIRIVAIGSLRHRDRGGRRRDPAGRGRRPGLRQLRHRQTRPGLCPRNRYARNRRLFDPRRPANGAGTARARHSGRRRRRSFAPVRPVRQHCAGWRDNDV